MDISISSQVIFFLICFSGWLAFVVADKRDSKLFLVTGVAILSLGSGLRGVSVGIDTYSYYSAFLLNFPNVWQFEEEGFRVISNLFMTIFENPQALFLIYSAVTNALISLRLWDFRSNASFSFMMFMYIAVTYIGTMNTMRQYLAVSIVFYATRYLEVASAKNYILFVTLVLVATSIHQTAIIGFLYLIVYVWINTSKKNQVILFLIYLIAIPTLVLIIIWFEIDHIDNYLSNGLDNLNLPFMYRAISFLGALILMWCYREKELRCSTIKSNRNNYNIIAVFYFIGLVGSSIGMFFSFMDRIGYYFILFEAVFWGRAVKYKTWGWLYFLMPTIYAFYVFTNELIFNGSGIFPYYLVFA